MKTIIRLVLLSFVLFSHTAFSQERSVQKYVLENINHYREEHGLSRLKLNSTVSAIAAKHSQAMAEHELSFGHSGFDSRMKSINMQLAAQGFAENVAFTSGPLRNMIEGWIESRGHRQNILGDYNETGIGTAVDENGWVYVTQIFVRVREQ